MIMALTTLENVKILLELEGTTDKDPQLNLIIEMIERQLKSRLGTNAVPEELDYVVVEIAVARFNRIGSEGMTSESVEGHSVSYQENDFAPYEEAIQRYLTKHNQQAQPRRGAAFFL